MCRVCTSMPPPSPTITAQRVTVLNVIMRVTIIIFTAANLAREPCYHGSNVLLCLVKLKTKQTYCADLRCQL